MPPELLIIFVKAPRPGQVKTRLAQSIGLQAACDAYRTLVDILIENLRALPNIQLRFSPGDALSEIAEWLQPTWKAAPQGSGDLGERLQNAFRQSFAAGAQRVVIIGSDSPDITRADVESAWTALATHDLVLGPAEDGGYWLIGLRSEQPALFHGFQWSANTVLKETLARAQASNLSTRLLRDLPDIDTIEDLRRFQARCSQQ